MVDKRGEGNRLAAAGSVVDAHLEVVPMMQHINKSK